MNIFTELTNKLVADAFYTGEVENEVRLLVEQRKKALEDFVLRRDSEREEWMETIEKLRCISIYDHPQNECTAVCAERGKNHCPCSTFCLNIGNVNIYSKVMLYLLFSYNSIVM